MNVANPFNRPSPFSASPQIVASSSSSPSMSYSYSSPYSNIIESQVRPMTVTDRPSINRTTSLNTGVYSYANDTVGFNASRGYELPSNYVPNLSSNSSFDVGGEIPTSKLNPFTRPSLLSNNYATAESYRPAPSNSYDNLSRNNDYQHLMYTPSSSVPSSSPALSGASSYADRGYSPNKYTRNNYNTNVNVNVEDDTASVRSYINKITDLQQRSPTDNPFTRRSITSVSPTTHRVNQRSTDINTEGYKDYSHLQYQPGSTKSNPMMPDHSGGLDKYRFQYQQQTQRSPHDKYQYGQYSEYSNSNSNNNNINNGYSSYDNIKPALDVQNQEESALANPYKFGSLQFNNSYSNNNNNSKERASSRDNKHTHDTGQRKYQFEDYHEKQQEDNDEDEREFDFNRKSQYEYELQRMEQMLKPNDYQNKQKCYQRDNHNQEQYKRKYDDKYKYDEQTEDKFDTNYRDKPEQLKYTAGFNYTQNNNNNSNNNNSNNNNNTNIGTHDDGNVGSGQYRSPQFGIAPSSYSYREGEKVTYTKADKRNQVVRFDDDDEQVQPEEVKQNRNPPSFMRGQEAPTKQSANRGHPTNINYRGSLFYEVELV